MNLEQTSKDVSRRLIDFLSGVAYANNGQIQRVANSTYIITPYNVDIMGDLLDELIISTALHSFFRSFSERDAAVISNNSIFYILSILLLSEPQHSQPEFEEHSVKVDRSCSLAGPKNCRASSGTCSRSWNRHVIMRETQT